MVSFAKRINFMTIFFAAATDAMCRSPSYVRKLLNLLKVSIG